MRHYREQLDPLVVFLLVLSIYVWSMPLTITLEDAGLFQMVCHLGGISHPPGYPLFTEICQQFVALPLFPDGVFAGNLLSSLFAAGGALMLFLCTLQLDCSRRVAWVAALSYGVSRTFWSQAIIIEVYSLAVLLFLLTWWLLLKFDRSGDSHWLYGAILSFSLSLANHWPLALLVSPALAATLSSRWADILQLVSRPIFWIALIGLGLAGLSPYVTLLMEDEPRIAVFGGVDSVSELAQYIARSQYEDTRETAGLVDKVYYAGWLLEQSALQFGLAGVPLLVLGTYRAFVQLARRHFVAIVLMYLGSTFLLNLLLGFPYEDFWQAIFIPYPVISYAALAVVFALGVVTLAEWIGTRIEWLQWPVLALLVISVFASSVSTNYRQANNLVEEHARMVLRTLPEDSILFVRGDSESHVFGYLHHVQDVRPDIELREWNDLLFDGRLLPAGASKRQLEAARDAYLAATQRPVFGMSVPLTPSTDYGAYVHYRPGEPDSVSPLPEAESFLDYLLAHYQGDLVTDPHERHWAFHRLAKFARQHAKLDISNALDERGKLRLAQMQQTFAGRLAILEAYMQAGRAPANLSMLRSIATDGAANIPADTPVRPLSAFHYYRGMLQLYGETNTAAAIEGLKESIQAYPASENVSVCALVLLYKQTGGHDQAGSLASRFPGAQCQ